MIQAFVPRYPRLEAIEVAVVENGRPSGERGFVFRNSGLVLDSETFLALYEPAQEETHKSRSGGGQAQKGGDGDA